MRASLTGIQPHPHEVILRHILNTVTMFLCSSADYFENWLLPNDLVIVRNHGDDEEEVWDTKNMLEIPTDMQNKVEIQTNLEFQSLTSGSTQSIGPPCIQIEFQDACDHRFGYSTIGWKNKEIRFPMQPVSWEKSNLSRLELSKQDLFLEPSWCYAIYFGLIPHVLSWILLGTCPRVRSWPHAYIFSSHHRVAFH
jgi:hypothetical protein